MHKLLKRQFKRLELSSDFISQHQELVSAISEAYNQNERTVKMLERSLFLTSSELNERNQALKAQLESEEKVQDELKNTIGMLNATFDATGEIIFIYDLNGQLKSTNSMGSALLKNYGIEKGSATTASFLELTKDKTSLNSFMSRMKQDPFCDIYATLETVDEAFFEVRSLPQIQDGVLSGRVWCLRDVTSNKKNEAMVQYQAYHDSLTGLPNRALLLDRIMHALTIAKRESNILAVLFIDLDNFKKVNDSEGHKAGDMLLIEVVRRLEARLREQDTLSRQGGDEFVILLESVKDQKNIKRVCKDLLFELQKPFDINNKQYFVTSSIGIALYPHDGITADELIRKADMAMYQSKEAGKNGFHFYSHELEEQALKQLEIEQSLRNLLNRNELSIAFQPKVDLNTHTITSVEVLARWYKKDGSVVPPNVFIEIAEQTGLIEELGCQVITLALTHLKKWNDNGIRNITISLNLSSIEFQSKAVISHLLHTMEAVGINGKNIIIELTESIFMEDKDKVSDTMRKLNKRGITFALDDFGKGYSSFSYLHSLPLHYLKIDKAFLSDIENNEHSATITKTIIDVGHNLGLKVIAEGVENQYMLDYISKHKCDIAQGYYLFKPISENMLLESLQAEKTSITPRAL